MPLSDHSHITVAELKAELRGGHAVETGYDARLEQICNIASDEMDRWLNRLVVSRGPITSYFSPRRFLCDLYFREWPVISVTSVHEDSGRTWGDDSALVENTDFIVSKPADSFGFITRVSGSLDAYWLTGRRVIKVVYTAGYANTAAVPLALKQQTVELAKLIYLESQKAGSSFAQSETGPLGNIQRWTSAIVTKRTDDALSAGGFKRPEHFFEYEERTA